MAVLEHSQEQAVPSMLLEQPPQLPLLPWEALEREQASAEAALLEEELLTSCCCWQLQLASVEVARAHLEVQVSPMSWATQRVSRPEGSTGMRCHSPGSCLSNCSWPVSWLEPMSQPWGRAGLEADSADAHLT